MVEWPDGEDASRSEISCGDDRHEEAGINP